MRKCPKCGFNYGEFDVCCSRCGYKFKNIDSESSDIQADLNAFAKLAKNGEIQSRWTEESVKISPAGPDGSTGLRLWRS